MRFTRWDATTDVSIGLLIEYHSWEKIATILYRGEVLRVRGENVEKAGKKDFEDR